VAGETAIERLGLSAESVGYRLHPSVPLPERQQEGPVLRRRHRRAHAVRAVQQRHNRLSTHFQFGDHIATGYVFDNNWEVALKLQHFSNGGYKKPNTGINYIEVKAAYHF
jgi:hypothetical protein